LLRRLLEFKATMFLFLDAAA